MKSNSSRRRILVVAPLSRGAPLGKNAATERRGYRPMACIVALLFASCLGSKQFEMIPAEGPPPTAQYLELKSEVAAATLHFPAGSYTLYATDSTGYYYRAPRKIIQHTGGGSVPHEGGVYVRKRDPDNIRGYVFISGALTHVGNFSDTQHEFR